MLGRWNEIINVRYLAKYPTHSKCSIIFGFASFYGIYWDCIHLNRILTMQKKIHWNGFAGDRQVLEKGNMSACWESEWYQRKYQHPGVGVFSKKVIKYWYPYSYPEGHGCQMLPGAQESLLEMFVANYEEGKQESQQVTGMPVTSLTWYTRVKAEHGGGLAMSSLLNGHLPFFLAWENRSEVNCASLYTSFTIKNSQTSLHHCIHHHLHHCSHRCQPLLPSPPLPLLASAVLPPPSLWLSSPTTTITMTPINTVIRIIIRNQQHHRHHHQHHYISPLLSSPTGTTIPINAIPTTIIIIIIFEACVHCAFNRFQGPA